MITFKGFVYSRLSLMGSRSEGPVYYLQQADEVVKDIVIEKQASLWQEDPALQEHLGHKAIIDGELVEGKLRYKMLRHE